MTKYSVYLFFSICCLGFACKSSNNYYQFKDRSSNRIISKDAINKDLQLSFDEEEPILVTSNSSKTNVNRAESLYEENLKSSVDIYPIKDNHSITIDTITPPAYYNPDYVEETKKQEEAQNKLESATIYEKETNPYIIASAVSILGAIFFFPLLLAAPIFAIIGLSQIRKNPERYKGRKLGFISLFLSLILLFTIGYIIFLLIVI